MKSLTEWYNLASQRARMKHNPWSDTGFPLWDTQTAGQVSCQNGSGRRDCPALL